MRVLLKLIACVVLLAFAGLAIVVVDLVWNDSRLFYRVMGADRMIGDCRPATLESLIGKGYSPVDLAFGTHPSVEVRAGLFGHARTIQDQITFSDGVDGPALQGIMACDLSGHTIRVEVEVESLPRRAA